MGVATSVAASSSLLLFFFNDPATTEIYTLSLHDALPIFFPAIYLEKHHPKAKYLTDDVCQILDRKSTRLNSSHRTISYAVFCLKKKTHLNNARAFANAKFASPPPVGSTALPTLVGITCAA